MNANLTKIAAQKLAVLIVLVLPQGVLAQDMDFTTDEQPAEEGTETSEGVEPSTEESPDTTGDVISDLAGEGDTAPERTVDDGAPRAEAREEIYAVSRVYALRLNRVEVAPSVSVTLNDPFVAHTGVGLALNYWWTNVLAVGLSFIWYEGLQSESDLNFQVRRSTRVAVPINEYQLAAHLNFTYVPLYGKFAFLNEFIFEYDTYVVGGVGFMRTRPIPVIDPAIRTFDWDFRVAFNVGLGLRVFVARWFAVFAEIRDYMYLERLENLRVELGDARNDAASWTQSSPVFLNNVTAHVGFTIFLPPDVEYRRPR